MGVLHELQKAYIKAHPHPRTRPTQSWDQLCALGMFQSNLDIWGWRVSPRVTGPNATDIANASGPLNSNWRAAPRGAFHYWTNHVAFDCSGGGTDLAMYGTSNLGETLVPFAGFQSVPGYTRQTYRGWATNYGGGVPNLPAEPAAPVPTPTQRQVKPTDNSNRRTTPTVPAAGQPSNIGAPPLLAGSINEVEGWVTDLVPANVIGGTNAWFRIGGLYSHASTFTNPATTGLTDLNPPPVVEPPIEPPVVEPAPGEAATVADVTRIVAESEARMLDAIKAIPAPPTAAAIADAVNDDAAARLAQ